MNGNNVEAEGTVNETVKRIILEDIDASIESSDSEITHKLATATGLYKAMEKENVKPAESKVEGLDEQETLRADSRPLRDVRGGQVTWKKIGCYLN